MTFFLPVALFASLFHYEKPIVWHYLVLILKETSATYVLLFNVVN